MAFCYDPDNNRNGFYFTVPPKNSCGCRNCNRNCNRDCSRRCPPPFHPPICPPVIPPAVLPIATFPSQYINSAANVTPNTIYLLGVTVNCPTRINDITINLTSPQTAPPVGANTNVVGLYSATTNQLIAISSAQNAEWSTAGEKKIAVTQKVLDPGKYYIAVLGNSTGVSLASSTSAPLNPAFGTSQFLQLTSGLLFETLPSTLPSLAGAVTAPMIYAKLS